MLAQTQLHRSYCFRNWSKLALSNSDTAPFDRTQSAETNWEDVSKSGGVQNR